VTIIFETVHGSRAYGALIALLSLLSACSDPSKGPPPASSPKEGVTAVLAHWDRPRHHVLEEVLARFTQETGIAVNFVPAPNERVTRMRLYTEWLNGQAPTPDVYQADVSESGLLAGHMLDLAPYLGAEGKLPIPAVMSNYRLDGRLIAMPLYTDVGVLFYRTDLLDRYGYSHPPETWDELEVMAEKIQRGERARGDAEFWGLAWPGRSDDDLFCVAIEVQASHGGGQIIEPDRSVSVNNPHTVRALTRMKGWIGRISPAGTPAYGPLDARGLWTAGDAAFLLSWPYVYARSQAEGSMIRGKLDVAEIPTGGGGHLGALGGWQLSVSRYSRHPHEAVALVRFLTGREEQVRRAVTLSGLPPTLDVYDDPEVLRANPYFARIKAAILHGTVARPWVASGPAYAKVAEAYTAAVHSVLVGEQDAGPALASLEKQLAELTGFRVGPPTPPAHP
jgi:trehalose/maltose transport system substrate-binding protein